MKRSGNSQLSFIFQSIIFSMLVLTVSTGELFCSRQEKRERERAARQKAAADVVAEAHNPLASEDIPEIDSKIKNLAGQYRDIDLLVQKAQQDAQLVLRGAQRDADKVLGKTDRKKSKIEAEEEKQRQKAEQRKHYLYDQARDRVDTIKQKAEMQAFKIIHEAEQRALELREKLELETEQDKLNARAEITESWQADVRSSVETDTYFIKNIIMEGEASRIERDNFTEVLDKQAEWFDNTITGTKYFFDDNYNAVVAKKHALSVLVDAQKQADEKISEVIDSHKLSEKVERKLRLLCLYEINAYLRSENKQGFLHAKDINEIVKRVTKTLFPHEAITVITESSQLKELEQRVAELEHDLNKTKSERDILQEASKKLSTSLKKSRKKSENLKEKYISEKERRTQMLKTIKEVTKALHKKIDDAQKNLDAERAEIERNKEAVQNVLKESIEQASGDVSKKREEIQKALQESIEQAQQELFEKQKEADKKQKEIDKLVAERVKNEKELSKQERELAQREREEARREKERASEEKERFGEKEKQRSKESARVIERLQKAHKQIAELKDKLEQAESDKHAAASQQKSEASGLLGSLKNREEEVKMFEKREKKLGEELDVLRSGSSRKIRKLENELHLGRQSKLELKNLLQEKQREHARLHIELAKAREEVKYLRNSSVGTAKRLKDEMREREDQVREARIALARKEVENQDLIKRIRDKQKSVTELMIGCAKARESMKHLKEQLHHERAKLQAEIEDRRAERNARERQELFEREIAVTRAENKMKHNEAEIARVEKVLMEEDDLPLIDEFGLPYAYEQAENEKKNIGLFGEVGVDLDGESLAEKKSRHKRVKSFEEELDNYQYYFPENKVIDTPDGQPFDPAIYDLLETEEERKQREAEIALEKEKEAAAIAKYEREQEVAGYEASIDPKIKELLGLDDNTDPKELFKRSEVDANRQDVQKVFTLGEDDFSFSQELTD